MREHPFRRQVIEEMHLRRWPPLTAPGSMIQVMRIVATEEREEERAQLRAALGVTSETINPDARHISGELAPGLTFTYERHTEGSSVAIFISPNVADADRAAARSWVENLPGLVVRATEISLVADKDAAEELIPEIGLRRIDTVSCRTDDGVCFWSDYLLHENGFGRLIVAACGADPATLSRRVRQVQELGNYRNLALLGLPAVREQWPELDEIERKLRAFAQSVSDPNTRDDALLEDVSNLSLELATLNNAIGYRLDATKAYATLVSERLEDLGASPVPDFQSLTDFIRRRFLPAERTCAAHYARLQHLTNRAADVTALLRARIETRIENQNALLLKSMERRATMQLRLQQLVEGLSIVAISYYAIGLLAYMLKGAAHVMPIDDLELVIGLAVPVVMLVIWQAMRIAKRRVIGDLDI